VPVRPDSVRSSLDFATLVPRAPPVPIHPRMLREGCAGCV
jgi:hypothetical protein